MNEPVGKLPTEPVLFKDNPDLCKRWCRYMWWHRLMPLKAISEVTGCPRLLLTRWVNGKNRKDADGWAYQRKNVALEVVGGVIADEKARIDDTLERLLDVLEVYIEKLSNEGEDLSVEEIRSLTSTYKELFNIRQLLMGRPTEIGDKKITWEIVMQKLKSVDIIEYDGQRVISGS